MVSKLHYFRTFKSFAKWVKELGYSLKTAKEAWKAVDWAHEIDWAQGYYYAKGVVEALLGANKKYGNLSEREIEMIEKHWEALAKELHLPQTIDPWELKALFE